MQYAFIEDKATTTCGFHNKWLTVLGWLHISFQPYFTHLMNGAFERKPTFEGRPIINVEAFRVRSHSANLEEAAKVAARMTLKGFAKNITCPIYIVAGTKDRLTSPDEARKLAAEVAGPCVLSVIEGGNHVVNNLWYRYRDQTADWMADQLAAPRK